MEEQRDFVLTYRPAEKTTSIKNATSDSLLFAELLNRMSSEKLPVKKMMLDTSNGRRQILLVAQATPSELSKFREFGFEY